MPEMRPLASTTTVRDLNPRTSVLHPELGPREWMVGLESWVIADGNYLDFEVGERRRFALEFWASDLRSVPAATNGAAVSGGDNAYDVVAQVAFQREGLIFVDFGLLAYGEFSGALHGDWLKGSLALAVDHFSYFETYALLEGAPAAIYTWTVTGIWRQTGPYVLVRQGLLDRRGYWIRDGAQVGYEEVDATGIATADGEHGDFYIMRCRVEDIPPTRRLDGRS